MPQTEYLSFWTTGDYNQIYHLPITITQYVLVTKDYYIKGQMLGVYPKECLGVTASDANLDIAHLLRGLQRNTGRGLGVEIVILSICNLTVTSLISPVGLISPLSFN